LLRSQSVVAEWAALTAKARSALLWRWHHLVEQHKEDLAVLMTAEQGKPLAEARGEVDYGNSFLGWFAEEVREGWATLCEWERRTTPLRLGAGWMWMQGRRVYGDTLPMNSAAMRGFVIKQPVGVCAAITPWNFPNAMITRKVALPPRRQGGTLRKPKETALKNTGEVHGTDWGGGGRRRRVLHSPLAAPWWYATSVRTRPTRGTPSRQSPCRLRRFPGRGSLPPHKLHH
jgi:delta 1-pyrroline-5-carboxylate dehydrogenase